MDVTDSDSDDAPVREPGERLVDPDGAAEILVPGLLSTQWYRVPVPSFAVIATHDRID